jgi:D-beta-D-heptose 7-phosphate kinase/D-beta-D-heptose 1-phosphate adenosyltransferase
MYHNIVVLSGGFDPIHEGHISMLREARLKYSKVVVGINSDLWLERKKGKAFMTSSARRAVLEAISYVDIVVEFNDNDNTAIDLLRQVKNTFPGSLITFGNGGDRAEGNYPEFRYCMDNKILLDDSLGGVVKQNSSSKLLEDWSNKKQARPWGYWRVLYDYPDNKVKVKELVVKPGCALSWQKHTDRGEVWYTKSGRGTLARSYNVNSFDVEHIRPDRIFKINKGEWHRIENSYSDDLIIVEIQYGERCVEEDIERAPFCT